MFWASLLIVHYYGDRASKGSMKKPQVRETAFKSARVPLARRARRVAQVDAILDRRFEAKMFEMYSQPVTKTLRRVF